MKISSMSFSTTFGMMTLIKMILSITKTNITLIIRTISIPTFSIMAFSIMTFSILAFIKMTLNIVPFIITTFIIIDKLTLSITLNKHDTLYNDTQQYDI
jgi:hypothetical protein